MVVAIVAMAGCKRESKPPPVVSEPTLSVDDPRLVGASGVCTVARKGDCPDVGDLMAGDGVPVKKLPPVTPSILPSWDLVRARDFACSYACAPVGSKAHLVAWSVIEDDRPLRNHNALFAIEHVTEAGPPKWTLVDMYRHATNDGWNIHVNFHMQTRPVVPYDHAPKNAEVYEMLETNGWQWDQGVHGFRLLAGNVIDPEWKAVTGTAPGRMFPSEVER